MLWNRTFLIALVRIFKTRALLSCKSLSVLQAQMAEILYSVKL